MSETIACRRFTESDQAGFAELSGDFNPIHVDEESARRTLAGRRVVHGMHAVLWVLDSIETVPTKLRVNFSKPMFLGEELSLTRKGNRLSIIADGVKVVDMVVNAGSCASAPMSDSPESSESLTAPASRSLEECAAVSGRHEPLWRNSLARELFPSAVARLGGRVCAELAAISTIVGMRCPGLNSLLSSVDISFAASDFSPLSYTVTNVDQRFSLLDIAVSGASLHGTVRAFCRPPPVSQLRYSDIASLVRPDEFAGRRALVVGGSRGLGEVAAKILAAGGASVTITYAHSSRDAENVVEEIRAAGRACESARFLAETPCPLPAANLVLYFATPKIFGKRGSDFDQARVEALSAVYVSGFEHVVREVLLRNSDAVFFYPSSVAIDQPLPELAEYIAAKLEGERRCSELARSLGASILTYRLPRILTDQTASIVAAPAASAPDVLLPLLRSLSSMLSVDALGLGQ